MIANESVIDYITQVEELQSNLREIDEQVSQPMLISIILKGPTDDFKYFLTLCKFSKNEKNLNSDKGDLVNVEIDERQLNSVERPESTNFGNNRQTTKLKCNFCGKMGNKEEFCFANDSNKNNINCHIFCTSGHLAKDCCKPRQNKNYCSFYKKNNLDSSDSLKLKNRTINND